MRATIIIGAAAICAAIVSGCEKGGPQDEEISAIITISVDRPDVKSSFSPDEDKISDLNVFFFASEDSPQNDQYLEERLFVRSSSLSHNGSGYSFHTKLLKGKSYDIYVAANLGYELIGITTIEQLKNYRFHLAYPDELRAGIPMSGFVKNRKAEEDELEEYAFNVTLRRLMSKVSLSVDRSQLGKGFEYKVKSVRICGSPRSALLFGSGGAVSRSDFFASGYTKSDPDTFALNTADDEGKSGTLSLYCLENIQDGSDTTLCSYIEMEAEYQSDTLRSVNGNCLIYRFYLGSEKEPYILRRNHEYKVSVMPVGRGLNGNGWRIDTENLEPYTDIYYKFYPATYIETHIGEKVHLWCEYSPPYAELEIDSEFLEDSRESGIWTYELDEDGCGVTLTITGGGMALAYFEVGEPVNESSLCVIISEP